MRLDLILLLLLAITMAVACCNCLGANYFNPPVQWYNSSYEPAENVTIGMIIYTMRPQPVTIGDSGSGRIDFSAYANSPPQVYHDMSGNQLNISFWLPGSSEVNPGLESDTFVYLPPGLNYTLLIFDGGDGKRQSSVTSKYTGGNLTLWVNDPDHDPYAFYEQNRNSLGYQTPD